MEVIGEDAVARLLAVAEIQDINYSMPLLQNGTEGERSVCTEDF